MSYLKEIAWTGETGRPLQLQRPCPCGCDQRDGSTGVGYLTGSDEHGAGFTIWIDDEAVYQLLARMLGATLSTSEEVGRDHRVAS